MAFSLLANSNPEINESQEMELTIESLSFYVGPSGSTRLSDPMKSGPSASKDERITISISFVGSSCKRNSRNSMKLGENLRWKQQRLKLMIVQGILPSKAVVSPEAYISYALLSLK
jgi:hypothetical protein